MDPCTATNTEGPKKIMVPLLYTYVRVCTKEVTSLIVVDLFCRPLGKVANYDNDGSARNKFTADFLLIPYADHRLSRSFLRAPVVQSVSRLPYPWR